MHRFRTPPGGYRVALHFVLPFVVVITVENLFPQHQCVCDILSVNLALDCYFEMSFLFKLEFRTPNAEKETIRREKQMQKEPQGEYGLIKEF